MRFAIRDRAPLPRTLYGHTGSMVSTHPQGRLPGVELGLSWRGASAGSGFHHVVVRENLTQHSECDAQRIATDDSRCVAAVPPKTGDA